MAKENGIPGIKFSKEKRNPTIDSDACLFELPFYKDAEYFALLENLNKFIKGVEDLCRKSKYYSRYVKYIKEDIGLKTCQVLSNIDIRDDSDVTIEMHHGPMLTLYDYCLVVIDYLLATEYPKITTFAVADIIMREHYANNIQVVMLSKTAHEAVDEGLFINYKQGYGNIAKFIEKYRKGLSKELVEKINTYLDMCEKYGSYDNMIFDVKNSIKSWAIEELL